MVASVDAPRCQLDMDHVTVTVARRELHRSAEESRWRPFGQSPDPLGVSGALVLGDDQPGQLLAYRFTGGITEDGLGRGVPLEHDALRVDVDVGVGRRVQDPSAFQLGGQPAGVGADARAQVDQQGGDARRGIEGRGPIAHRAPQMKGPAGSVSVDPSGLVRRSAPGLQPLDRRVGVAAVVGMYELTRRLADQLLRFVAEHVCGGGVHGHDDPVRCGLDIPRRALVHEPVEMRVTHRDRLVGSSSRTRRGRVLCGPGLQLPHDLVGEHEEHRLLVGARGAHPGVQHAQGADRGTTAGHQRRAGVEADVGRIQDHRVLLEAGVGSGVPYHQHAALPDGVVGERHLPGGLRQVETDAGLEPLPVAAHQADQCGRCVEDPCHRIDDVVELGLGLGVEDLQAPKGGEPFHLIGHGQPPPRPLPP